MAENSKIEWTHHTFNPWWGCQKVSEGCANCYALTLSHRWGHDVWGPAKTTSRRMMSEGYWKQPLKWDKEAAASGERKRVFCASMADVFEDHPQVVEARRRLFNLIFQTPHLDWLLLTKRPENIRPMLQQIEDGRGHNVWDHLWMEYFQNVWLGTSAENQEQADKRIPELLRIPARVHFLSCEPLLGPLDLSQWLPDLLQPIHQIPDGDAPIGVYDSFSRQYFPDPAEVDIEWVICGGESGPGARPMHPDWARSLRDQCQAAGVAYHFKQWGEYQYGERRAQREEDGSVTFHSDGIPMHIRVGKHAAGRLLDGQLWDEFPI